MIRLTWHLLQYRETVDRVLNSTPNDIDSLEIRLDLLAERGNLCRRPISAPVEDGIFELRGTGSTRLLFYFRKNREILFVHSVNKKQSKLDRRDIDLAKTLRRKIEADEKDRNLGPLAGRD